MMSATGWYLLGCATGAFCMLVVCAFTAMTVWPDLKLMRRR